MDKFFKLSERNTNVKTEILAGVTTFLSMAYILAVNPYMLGDTGMDIGAVFTVTALIAALACIFMGLYANFPIALAPGMGMNAFFTYSVVLTLGYTWQEALFGIFISGCIFIVISFTGIREKIINMIPNTLKFAVSAGIGLFIAFIGMQNAGIIVNDDATLVALGDFTNPVTLLAVIGVLITFALTAKGVRASIFFGMLITMIIGVCIQLAGFDVGIVKPETVVSLPNSIEPVALKAFTESSNFRLLLDPTFWVVILSFLFVDFFDTAGTILAAGREADLVDQEGNLIDAERALLVDASATTLGAVLGTSSTTSYVESMAGIKAGGRTGLTAVTVGVCFIIAMFFSGLLSLVVSAVTAPALITVGAMMAVNKGKIDFSDFANTAGAFMTMSMMVLSYSISEGISAGFITYVVCKVAQGESKDVPKLMYVLTLLFALHYFI